MFPLLLLYSCISYEIDRTLVAGNNAAVAEFAGEEHVFWGLYQFRSSFGKGVISDRCEFDRPICRGPIEGRIREGGGLDSFLLFLSVGLLEPWHSASIVTCSNNTKHKEHHGRTFLIPRKQYGNAASKWWFQNRIKRFCYSLISDHNQGSAELTEMAATTWLTMHCG